MNRVLAFIASAGALFLSSCADSLDQQTTQELGERFQKGITGEGTIVPRDRSDDPFVRSNEPGGPGAPTEPQQ